MSKRIILEVLSALPLNPADGDVEASIVSVQSEIMDKPVNVVTSYMYNGLTHRWVPTLAECNDVDNEDFLLVFGSGEDGQNPFEALIIGGRIYERNGEGIKLKSLTEEETVLLRANIHCVIKLEEEDKETVSSSIRR